MYFYRVKNRYRSGCEHQRELLSEKSDGKKHAPEHIIILPVLIIAIILFTEGCAGRSSAPVLETYRSEETEANNDAGTGEAAGGSSARPLDVVPDEKNESPLMIIVHVCGAVKKEGVYTLPEGSRIRDAVDAAGGFERSADTTYLNLAVKLEDSWQIHVPTKEEAQTLRRAKEQGEPVDPLITRGAEYEGDSTEKKGPRTENREEPGEEKGTGKETGREDKRETGEEAGAAEEGKADDESGNSSGSRQKININSASLEELTVIPGIGESKAKSIIEYREKNGRFETIEDIMNVTGIKENTFRKLRDYITVKAPAVFSRI